MGIWRCGSTRPPSASTFVVPRSRAFGRFRPRHKSWWKALPGSRITKPLSMAAWAPMPNWCAMLLPFPRPPPSSGAATGSLCPLKVNTIAWMSGLVATVSKANWLLGPSPKRTLGTTTALCKTRMVSIPMLSRSRRNVSWLTCDWIVAATQSCQIH